MRVGNGAYNQAQHDVWGAVLDSIFLHTTSRDQLPERRVADADRAGRGGAGELARARPGDLGGARRAQALHLVEDDVLGGGRSRRAAGASSARTGTAPRAGGRRPTRSTQDICEHAIDERGVFTQHYDTDALDASVLLMPLVRFLPPDDARIKATVLAVADELTEYGLVLRYRVEETDDGLNGRRGDVHDLLVLAGVGAGEIGELERARICASAAVLREPARPVRRGDRPAHRPSSRQLPAGVHAPGADQRGCAHRLPERRAGARCARARGRNSIVWENSLTCDSSRLSHAASVRVSPGTVRVAQTDTRAEGQRESVQTVKPRERNTAGKLSSASVAPMRLSYSDRPAAFHAVVSRMSPARTPCSSSVDSCSRVWRSIGRPRGIWLDEAITIHQARLWCTTSSRIYNGDRQPPLYPPDAGATISRVRP